MASKKEKRTRLEKAYDLYKEKEFDLLNNPKNEDLPNEQWELLMQAAEDEFLEQLKANEEECVRFLENDADIDYPMVLARLLGHFNTNKTIAQIIKAECDAFFAKALTGTFDEETAYYRDLLVQAEAVLS